MQAMEHRMELSIDKKLEHHTKVTESKLNTFLEEVEDNTNKSHKQFYKDVAILIAQTVNESVNASVNASIAASMEKLESRMNLSMPSDNEMMDITGTDMLPLKRSETQNENIPLGKSKLNINALGTKTSDWKQRKLI